MVKTEFDLSVGLLEENLKYFEENGAVSFEILLPLLKRARPEQLLKIDCLNLNLIEEFDKLWEPICKHKFCFKKRLDSEPFQQMYERCVKEDGEKIKKLAQMIKQRSKTPADNLQKRKLTQKKIEAPSRRIQKPQKVYKLKIAVQVTRKTKIAPMMAKLLRKLKR